MSKMTKADYRTYLAERGIKTTAKTPLTELRRLYADAELTAAEQPKAEITFVNTGGGAVQAHAAGCRDLDKVGKGNHDEIAYTASFATADEATADFNDDFDKETDGWYEIEFKPCVKFGAARVLAEPKESKPAKGSKAAPALPALEVRIGRRAISVVQGGSWVAWVKVGTDISGEGRTGRSRVNFGTDGSWIAAGRVEEIRTAITAALAAAESTAA